MKIFVYNLGEFDERPFFDDICKELKIEYSGTDKTPTVENAYLAEGYDAIDILTCPMDAARLDEFKKMGIKLVISRTIGTDHIDKKYAEEIGIGVAGITYSPNSVADYAIMLMLIGCRKLKYIIMRSLAQDYGLKGRLAKELNECSVGIIGGGAIGKEVAKSLRGFGCRINICDRHPDDEIAGFATYTDMETIFRTSDIITLHLSGTEENRHLIDRESFDMMKDGVIFINTARGLLVDTEAMIDAIESGKIGFAGLDVVENEIGRYYYDHEDEVLCNRYISIINGYPNALVLPHMGFYTDSAVRDMVVNSVIKAKEYLNDQN